MHLRDVLSGAPVPRDGDAADHAFLIRKTKTTYSQERPELTTLHKIAAAAVLSGVLFANAGADVGKALPPFALLDGIGDTYRSADFEGKVIVLYHFGFD